MDHHQRSAPLDIVPLPASHTPVKSESKLLADILRMVMETPGKVLDPSEVCIEGIQRSYYTAVVPS